jgi:hypothetical protein
MPCACASMLPPRHHVCCMRALYAPQAPGFSHRNGCTKCDPQLKPSPDPTWRRSRRHGPPSDMSWIATKCRGVANWCTEGFGFGATYPPPPSPRQRVRPPHRARFVCAGPRSKRGSGAGAVARGALVACFWGWFAFPVVDRRRLCLGGLLCGLPSAEALPRGLAHALGDPTHYRRGPDAVDSGAGPFRGRVPCPG